MERDDIRLLSARQVVAMVAGQELSSRQVVEACLEGAEELDPSFHAFTHVMKSESLDAADRADAAVKAGERLGRLHGLPVSLKDCLTLKGTRTTIASKYLQGDLRTHDFDSACAAKLKDAGAIIIGKTNVGGQMPPAYTAGRSLPPPSNPWSLDHNPGGSSSGSAVAVSLGMCFASIGTDLGGSIRIPASFSGVVGFKPSFGRISQWGDIFGVETSLEHVGPITRSVGDAALLFEVLAGHDPRDPTTVERSIPKAVNQVINGLDWSSLKVGAASNGGPVGAHPEVLTRFDEAVAHLRAQGIAVEDVELPAYPERLWHEATLLESLENMRIPAAGEPAGYMQYLSENVALKLRKVVRELGFVLDQLRAELDALFDVYDVLVCPTVPVPPERVGELTCSVRGREREMIDLRFANTWVFNVGGNPAISVPGGVVAGGVPVGIQFVSARYREEVVLAVAGLYERLTGGYRRPPLWLGPSGMD